MICPNDPGLQGMKSMSEIEVFLRSLREERDSGQIISIDTTP